MGSSIVEVIEGVNNGRGGGGRLGIWLDNGE